MVRIPSAIRNVNIEPLCFVYGLGLSMMDVTRQDLLYQTVCMNNYGIAGSNCSELVKVNTSVKHDIERTTTYYIQACTLIESIIPSIFCLFVGPWTDEHGRKWPIVIGCIGITLTAGYYLVLTFLPRIEFWYFMAGSIFNAIGGGFPIFGVCVFSYLSDTSSVEWKTLRFVFTECALSVGYPLGLILSGQELDYLGFKWVFATSMSLGTGCVLYSLTWLRNDTHTRSETYYNLLDKEVYGNWHESTHQNVMVRYLKGSFQACFRPREGSVRSIIVLMMTVQLISDLGFFWTRSVLYMYSKDKFNWSASKYSNYAATASLIRAFGILVIFPMLKKVNMGDAIICALGSISNLLWSYFYGIAWLPWVLWMAAALGCIGSISAVTRAAISKLSEKEEIGKIFTLIAFAQCLMPLVGVPLMTALFNATLDIDPGIVFYLMALLSLPAFAISLYLDLILRLLNFSKADK